MAERAQHYHYADRIISVGDVYEMTEGYQQTVNAIWLDRRYGDCFHVEIVGERGGHDSTPGDFYRRIVRQVKP